MAMMRQGLSMMRPLPPEQAHRPSARLDRPKAPPALDLLRRIVSPDHDPAQLAGTIPPAVRLPIVGPEVQAGGVPLPQLGGDRARRLDSLIVRVGVALQVVGQRRGARMGMGPQDLVRLGDDPGVLRRLVVDVHGYGSHATRL